MPFDIPTFALVVVCTMSACLNTMSRRSYGHYSMDILAAANIQRAPFMMVRLRRSPIPFSSRLYGIFVLVVAIAMCTASFTADDTYYLELSEWLRLGGFPNVCEV